jgi:hypothetical protein
LETKVLADYEVRGLAPKPECKVDVMVSKIKCVVFDEFGNQKEFEIFAYLASVGDIPLILGFKDILEKLDLHIEFGENEAWLDYR